MCSAYPRAFTLGLDRNPLSLCNTTSHCLVNSTFRRDATIPQGARYMLRCVAAELSCRHQASVLTLKLLANIIGRHMMAYRVLRLISGTPITLSFKMLGGVLEFRITSQPQPLYLVFASFFRNDHANSIDLLSWHRPAAQGFSSGISTVDHLRLLESQSLRHPVPQHLREALDSRRIL